MKLKLVVMVAALAASAGFSVAQAATVRPVPTAALQQVGVVFVSDGANLNSLLPPPSNPPARPRPRPVPRPVSRS